MRCGEIRQTTDDWSFGCKKEQNKKSTSQKSTKARAEAKNSEDENYQPSKVTPTRRDSNRGQPRSTDTTKTTKVKG